MVLRDRFSDAIDPPVCLYSARATFMPETLAEHASEMLAVFTLFPANRWAHSAHPFAE